MSTLTLSDPIAQPPKSGQFFPRLSQDQRAVAVTIILFAAVGILGIVNHLDHQTKEPSMVYVAQPIRPAQAMTSAESDLLGLINRYRIGHSLPQLIADGEPQSLAQRSTNLWAATPAGDMFLLIGNPAVTAGKAVETIASGQSPEEVFQHLMAVSTFARSINDPLTGIVGLGIQSRDRQLMASAILVNQGATLQPPLRRR